jgi:hypothetical protein
MKLRYLAVTVYATFLAGAPTALAAGGSAGSGYGGQGGVENEVHQGAAAAASGGSLPFTGLDIALLVIGALALVVVGAGLRRMAKRAT